MAEDELVVAPVARAPVPLLQGRDQRGRQRDRPESVLRLGAVTRIAPASRSTSRQRSSRSSLRRTPVIIRIRNAALAWSSVNARWTRATSAGVRDDRSRKLHEGASGTMIPGRATQPHDAGVWD